MAMPSVYNLKAWVEENRDQLKPPVGNKMVYRDRELLVMVVGGPNRRKDFHIEDGEEFFYQIEGDIVLRIMEDGQPRDIPVRARARSFCCRRTSRTRRSVRKTRSAW